MPRPGHCFEHQITEFAARWPGEFPSLGKVLPFSSRVQNPPHGTAKLFGKRKARILRKYPGKYGSGPKEVHMKKFTKIIAPTDLSELSCLGLRYALELAREQSAEIIVLHVIPIGEDWLSTREESAPVRDLMAKERAALDNFLREKFAEFFNLIELRQRVEVGGPHANIAELAEREGADLIVMSTHGRTGLEHMLMGSVTEKVVARAPCPVLSIPAMNRKKDSAKAA
jgi:nucleotide-binding universal stress UspA family protein